MAPRVANDTEMKVAVLRKLVEWGPLPESDVSRMLRSYFLITDDYRDMSEEGLLDMRFVGDEYVLSLATLGSASVRRLFSRDAPLGGMPTAALEPG